VIAVLQRANAAAVRVDGQVVGEIGRGLLILLGVSREDGREDAERLAAKISKCRIFKDAEDKMNLSLLEVGGGALVVSNFTLLADYHHGNRPNYFAAAEPAVAEELYEYFVALLKKEVAEVATGVFGADMKISLEADGPVTIVMDSNVLKPKKEQRV
jgi:D-tyrosyl-tRNA(Tyr) deacylase